MIGYTENRNDFNRLIWKIVSPKWHFDDATYDRTAAAFANPDHVAIVIHNYRWRLGLAKGEPKYDDLEQQAVRRPGDRGADDHDRERLRRSRRRAAPPIATSSRASTRTESSRASATTCRRRRRRPSPRRSSPSTLSRARAVQPKDPQLLAHRVRL